MKSLFSRSFLGIAFSHFVVVLILSGSFVFAMQRSIDNWNVSRAQRLQNLLAPVIVRTFRSSGTLQEAAIHQAIRPFLNSNMFVYVTNREDEPVYFYSGGSQVSVHNRADLTRRMREVGAYRAMPISILNGSEIIGNLRTGTFGFRSDLANQALLRTLIAFLTAGLAVSAVFAVAIAFIVSRSLSREAYGVAVRIGALAEGRRDVTFSNRSATELDSIARSAEALQARLSTEERFRRRWMEDISHDLRTPIAAVKAQIEGLADGYIRPSPEKFAEIQTEFDHIERLVNDLRELTRVESPEMPIDRTSVDADLFARNLFNRYRDRAADQGVPFDWSVGVRAFCADEGLVERAVSNGLDNALRHVAPGGTIYLAIDRHGPVVDLAVGNTGTIDPGEAEQFFERFYRGTESVGRRGSGLGLSIVRAIAERHGGAARIEQTGEFTELVISVPWQEDCHEAVRSDEKR
jgi:two-component system, OmpR family, sensor histidine kinase BaeS